MAASSTPRTKIIWLWKCNLDPFDESQVADWKRYPDLQIYLIEEKYQNNQKSVELGDYIIDFKEMVQFKKDDKYRRRLVKREVIDVSRHLRQERFCIAEKPKGVSKSFGEPGAFFESAKLMDEWKRRYPNLCGSQDYSKVVEQAAKGIVHEARLLNQELDGQLIADQLLKVKHETQTKIHNCCIRLYSMDSFLYTLVNASLRNEDYSKVDTSGAYCYLLILNLYDHEKEDSTLYRGCQLTDEMINDYKDAVGTQIIWSAFTSLSRSREQAEQFGNTLFIVRLTGNVYCSKDIQDLSEYPHEEEVLLRPVHPLWIVKIDHDKRNKKYLIYMNDDPDYSQK